MFSRVADSRLDWICHFVRGHETVSPRWWPVKVPIPCGSCRFGELWAWADGVMRRSSPVTYSRALLVRERGRRALRYAVEFRTGEQLLDRRILERRAQENGVDFVNGVATAITPMAFYETVMVKGYEALVDSGTKVDVNTGMIAAARLQALIDSRAGKTSMADVLFKMDRIINAIHSNGARGAVAGDPAQDRGTGRG